MKTTFTLFKIALVLLTIVAPGKIFSQTYYDLYLHNGTTGTIKPAAGTAFAAGDQVIWTDTYNGTPSDLPPQAYTSPDLVVNTTSYSPGLHTFTMRVRSGTSGCDSDPSDAKTVFILPATTVTFANATDEDYCENVGSPSKTIVASAAPVTIALPDGIGYNYEWTITKDGVAATHADAGTLTALTGTASRETTSTFTMTTENVGVYLFTVKASYFKLDGNPGTVKLGATPAQFPTASPKKVTVKAKPAKPTIEIS